MEEEEEEEKDDDSDTVVIAPSPPVGSVVTPFSTPAPKLNEFEKGLSRTPYNIDHFDKSYTPLSGKYIWNKNWIYSNRSICDDNSKLNSTVRSFQSALIGQLLRLCRNTPALRSKQHSNPWPARARQTI